MDNTAYFSKLQNDMEDFTAFKASGVLASVLDFGKFAIEMIKAHQVTCPTSSAEQLIDVQYEFW